MSDGIRFAPKDRPLRADVSRLGALLGRVIREQGGDRLFERVETARSASGRRRRGGEKSAGAKLESTLRGLAPEDALLTVQAFSSWFGLVNLAERIHRVRRRQEHLAASGTQPLGLASVIESLLARGVTIDTIRREAAAIVIEPVFTAHPTEAARPEILAHEQRIAEVLLSAMGRRESTAQEDQVMLAPIHQSMSISWQTEENRMEPPTVADEVEHVLHYLVGTLYDVLPDIEEDLERRLELGAGDKTIRTQPLIRCGTWVGGDMDGNPAVGAGTIGVTLRRQRDALILRYRDEAHDLAARLTQSRSRIDVSPEFDRRLGQLRASIPTAASSAATHRLGMPYREYFTLVAARLDRSRSGEDSHGYSSAEELAEDLALAHRSLVDHRGAKAGARLAWRFARRVRAFGFHLAALDLRQDARVHRQVVAELLDRPDFEALDEDARTALLSQSLTKPSATFSEGSETTVAALAALRAAAAAQREHGMGAVGVHVISMARGVDDALALLLIARTARLVDAEGRVPLDVAPLFETVDDLLAAPDTLRKMLEHPLYREHLASRDSRQMVMLGYSDSSKDSGLVSARWALQRAQAELVAVAEKASIELTLFHGRGGTVSRGGGKPRDGILAQPPGSVRGRLRVTEQGEIINAKYGLHEIARRTLELITGAVLESTVAPPTPPVEGSAEIMDLIATASRSSYHSLVRAPGFFEFFREATPIDVIDRLRIGSRPPSRRAQRGIEDLRAIPWVFAWMQSRHVLPGWFGAGSGLRAAVERYGIEELRRLGRTWLYFRSLLSDIEMVIAKGDIDISNRYAALAGENGRTFQSRIVAEFASTRDVVCEIREQKELLEHDEVLQRAIRLRNPYIDPMSIIQVDLLSRWRAGGRTDTELERALVSSVKGIARGLQNTG